MEETRSVPIHPELVGLLRGHLAEFGTGSGGRVSLSQLERSAAPPRSRAASLWHGLVEPQAW